MTKLSKSQQRQTKIRRMVKLITLEMTEVLPHLNLLSSSLGSWANNFGALANVVHASNLTKYSWSCESL